MCKTQEHKLLGPNNKTFVEMAQKAISYNKVQIAVRVPGQTTCLHHNGITLDWFCESCDETICAQCVSSLHRGHDNVLLSNQTPTHKRKIKEFIDKSEKNDLIELEQQIISTEDKIKANLTGFEKLTSVVKKQGKNLKKEIDALTSQTLSQLKKMEEENNKLINDYKINLVEKLKELKEKLKECKDSLQTGTAIQVSDIASGLDTSITFPDCSNLSTAHFFPNTNPLKSLDDALGLLTLTTAGHSEGHPSQVHLPFVHPSRGHPSEAHLSQGHPSQGHTSKGHPPEGHLSQCQSQGQGNTDGDQPVGESAQQMPVATSKTGTTCPAPQVELLPQTKVLSEWMSPCDIQSICPTSGSGMWTCNYKTVTHLTIQGMVQQEIQSRVKVTDICLSPITHNLWACSKADNSVMELISDTLTHRFNTNCPPKSICVTMSNHILVGITNKITELSPSGKPGRSTATSMFRKPLVCTPVKMSQCPVSENVAVVDLDMPDDGGKDTAHVLVINNKLQEVFMYHGPQHTEGTGSCRFHPNDITYDSLGHLIIADCDNRCLYLVNGGGQHLRVLYTDPGHEAGAVSVGEGVVWGVFGGSIFGGTRVTQIQYTSV